MESVCQGFTRGSSGLVRPVHTVSVFVGTLTGDVVIGFSLGVCRPSRRLAQAPSCGAGRGTRADNLERSDPVLASAWV